MERLVPRAGITQISPYRPGRPSDSGRPFLNLSLSQNALGPGSQALAAYRQAAAAIHQYPDPEAGALRTAIADRYGLERDHILCSNGSDEMIQLIALAYAGPGDEVLFPRYAYHGFAHAARVAGATPVVATDRDLTADIEALADRAGERTRIVFLANPNNPTGSYLPIDTVHQLRRALPPHTLLVLDAA